MLLPKARSSGFVPPCIPTRAFKVPSGAGWVHEIKHDGYRLQVRRKAKGGGLPTVRIYRKLRTVQERGRLFHMAKSHLRVVAPMK
jgi:ATP-dependent DNA ligase